MQEGYSIRDFNQGPATYADKELADKLFETSGLKNLSGKVVLDLMSGPGKVAIGLMSKSPDNYYVALDGVVDLLKEIKNPEIRSISGDARALPLRSDSVDLVVVRYGLKDVPQEQQVGVLKGIHVVLKPGKRLIIADMMSPNEMKEWINNQHSFKQQFNGRNILADGMCNIPTESEWIANLLEAKFHVDVVDYHISQVKTSDWVNGGQITSDQQKELDAFILAAPDEVKDKFNIRQEGGDVKVDYPVIIIRATKFDRNGENTDAESY